MNQLPVSEPKSVPDQLKVDANPDPSMDLTGSDVEDDPVANTVAAVTSKTNHGKLPVPPNHGELIQPS